jgi:hypothetical protein
MIRLLVLLLGSLLPLGAAAFGQTSGIVITKTEARSMGEESLTRRLFGGLAPIVLPVPDRGQPGVRPTEPLRELSFFTVPVSSGVPGLCKTEKIMVELTPVGASAGADTPVRPRRFISESALVVRDWAQLLAYPRGTQDRDQARDNAACALIDPRSARIIWARSDYAFLESLTLFQEFIGTVQNGREPLSLDCSGVAGSETPLNDQQCRDRFIALDPRAVTGISTCDRPSAIGCQRIEFDDYWFDFIRGSDGQRTVGARLARIFIVPESPPID